MKKKAELVEYYTVAEAEKILRYSRRTMYNLLKSGQLPSRGSGKLRRIPRWAVDAATLKSEER